MSAFRIAHAKAADWRAAALACAEQVKGLDGANLGFVYVTDRLGGDLAPTLDVLRGATGIADWVGTVGVGVLATGQEYFDEPAIAVMTARLPEGAWRVFPSLTKGASTARGTARVSADAERWLDGARPSFGVVHADPRNPRTPKLIAELSEESASFLVGGLTSSRGRYDQVAGEVVSGGLSGVLFRSDVAVATGISQGCSPIGPTREVTQCQDNVLFTLDGGPALACLKRDMGDPADRDFPRAAENVHVALPVVGSDTGDYLVRNLVGIDPARGWVAIGDYVREGDRVVFCRRDASSARRDLDRMLKELKRRAGDGPKAGVYYSCVARGPNLFGAESQELAMIRDRLGDFPLVGFFCNGEICHNRLYGYTGVIALFL
ncbi:MAG: FIST signal transduction protein [Alphaproteobacteria bacterium]